MIDLDVKITDTDYQILEQSKRVYRRLQYAYKCHGLIFISAGFPDLSGDYVYLRGSIKSDDLTVVKLNKYAWEHSRTLLQEAFIQLAKDKGLILRLNGVLYGGRRQL